MDIHNQTTNSINSTLSNVVTHLQEKYGQLMLHKLLESKGIVKKTNYHPREPIATIFSAVEELLNFANITVTLYIHHQVVNMAYFNIHKSGRFTFQIPLWNRIKMYRRCGLDSSIFCVILQTTGNNIYHHAGCGNSP